MDAPKKCASDIGLLLNDSAVNLNGTENYVNGLSLPNCTYEARTIHIKSYTYERCRGRFVGNLFIAWNSTDPTYVNTFGFSIRVEPWFNEDYDYQIGMVTKEQGLSWEFRYSERPMWVLLPLEIDKVNKLTKLTSTDTTCAYDLFIGMPPTGDSANNEQTLLRHYSDADPFDPMSIGGGDQFDDLLDSFLYSLRLPAKCMPLLEIAASGEKSSGSRVNQTMSAGKWTFIATQAYMSPFDEMSTNFQVDRAFLSEDDPVDLVLEIMEYHSGNLVVKFLDRHEQSVMDDYCWSKPTNVPFNTTLVYGLPTKVAAVVTWTQGDEEATADAEPKGDKTYLPNQRGKMQRILLEKVETGRAGEG
ncbi:unnamed protein product, partial [Mesorhabditis belari]|uniref:Uncharacterized protein n=1 Tax=Mesorhabditis belari TaxID=2138241 RepID=A0AAF3FBD9_9BILA